MSIFADFEMLLLIMRRNQSYIVNYLIHRALLKNDFLNPRLEIKRQWNRMIFEHKTIIILILISFFRYKWWNVCSQETTTRFLCVLWLLIEILNVYSIRCCVHFSFLFTTLLFTLSLIFIKTTQLTDKWDSFLFSIPNWVITMQERTVWISPV